LISYNNYVNIIGKHFKLKHFKISDWKIKLLSIDVAKGDLMNIIVMVCPQLCKEISLSITMQQLLVASFIGKNGKGFFFILSYKSIEYNIALKSMGYFTQTHVSISLDFKVNPLISFYQ
jgi:hypothetical protein